MKKIVIYRFTGWQGLFWIPGGWCRECDLLARAVERVVDAAGLRKEVVISVRPWFLWFWQPLLKAGALHAPILMVDGRLISQGVVPSDDEIMTGLGCLRGVH